MLGPVSSWRGCSRRALEAELRVGGNLISGMRASRNPLRSACFTRRALAGAGDRLDALIAVVIEVSSEEERRPPHQHEDGDAAIRGSDRRDGRPSSSSAPRLRPVTWLRPGDCIDPASAENVTVEDLPVVPCGQPYDQKVIATRDLGPGPWPDDAAINARSDKICTLEFALYIGIPDNKSRYDLYSYPRTSSRGRSATAQHRAWSPIRAARQPARCAAPGAGLADVSCRSARNDSIAAANPPTLSVGINNS